MYHFENLTTIVDVLFIYSLGDLEQLSRRLYAFRPEPTLNASMYSFVFQM